MRSLILAAATALALGAALPASAQPRPDEPAQMTRLPSDSAGYARAAAQADRFEIEAGKLAIMRGRSEKVRDFAKMMVDAHSASLDHLTQVIMDTGLPPPDTASPRELVATMDALQQAKPQSSEFDQRYIASQIQAHREALALHRNYVDKGDNPGLLAHARGSVVVTAEHQDTLNRIGG